MTKDKQIEEMTKILCTDYDMGKCMVDSFDCLEGHCSKRERIEALHTAGYRKADDVAREVFEEIEKEIELALDSNYRAKKEHYNHSVIPNYDNFKAMCDGKIYAMRGLLDFIA